jgi:hypothetical protein
MGMGWDPAKHPCSILYTHVIVMLLLLGRLVQNQDCYLRPKELEVEETHNYSTL